MDNNVKNVLVKRIIFIVLIVAVIIGGIGFEMIGARPVHADTSSMITTSTLKAGDHIYMGKRNVKGFKGLPYWRVLSVDASNKRALLLSEYLWNERVAFREDRSTNLWDGSDAQTWCKAFYKNVLESSELVKSVNITETQSVQLHDDFYFPPTSISSSDRVFYPSALELKQCLNTDFSYDNKLIAYIHDGFNYSDTFLWYLRNPQNNDDRCVYYIGMDGTAYVNEPDYKICPRPAFYLNLETGISATKDKNGDWIIGDSGGASSVDIPKTSISKLNAGKGKIVVKWKKKSVAGYQIQCDKDKYFFNAKTKTVKKGLSTSATIESLKSKKKYYVRVRTYKVVSGKKYYSAWSKTKTIKTK